MKTVGQRMYAEMLSQCRKALVPLGFKRAGNNFRVKHGANVGVINVQRSQWGSADELRFTINLGVWSHFLAKYWTVPKSTNVLEHHCHWRTRIGELLDNSRGDVWWTISPATNPAKLVAEIVDVLTKVAAPAILSRLSDKDLATSSARSPFDPSPGLPYLLCLRLVHRHGKPPEVQALQAAYIHRFQDSPETIAKIERLLEGLNR